MPRCRHTSKHSRFTQTVREHNRQKETPREGLGDSPVFRCAQASITCQLRHPPARLKPGLSSMRCLLACPTCHPNGTAASQPVGRPLLHHLRSHPHSPLRLLRFLSFPTIRHHTKDSQHSPSRFLSGPASHTIHRICATPHYFLGLFLRPAAPSQDTTSLHPALAIRSNSTAFCSHQGIAAVVFLLPLSSPSASWVARDSHFSQNPKSGPSKRQHQTVEQRKPPS